ncbi:hypothetical protein GS676_02660 [Rhodococcus hoagii]|nr:hypothetical protein [Prescottella equi]
MINHLDGHTRLVAYPTLTLTRRRAIQLVLEQDGRELGIQITRELAAQIVALLEDPKGD